MLTLYIRPDCPYSKKAMAACAELGIAYTKKDINDPIAMQELLERGGKDQVPFLYGEDGDVNMYESDTIVRYLSKRAAS